MGEQPAFGSRVATGSYLIPIPDIITANANAKPQAIRLNSMTRCASFEESRRLIITAM
jgi:hypothetical protein